MEEEGRERERGGGEREIKINSDLASQSQWHVYLLPWQLESTHNLHVSTAMKKAWGNSCCQLSESYTDGLTHSSESGYWHIQPIQWVHTHHYTVCLRDLANLQARHTVVKFLPIPTIHQMVKT